MVIPRKARRITYSTEIRNLKKRLSLNKEQEAVVIGSILGDGTLEQNWSKTNYRLRVDGSTKQKSYILWKYKILKEWVLTEPKYRSATNSIAFRTISHHEITYFGHMFYGNKRKIIPSEVTTLIQNPLVLATWFMDDGNVIRRNGKVYGYHLNTQSFTKKENTLLSRALYNVYGIESLLEKNHEKYRIRIMRERSRNKLKSIIGKYILDDMYYKLQ
jgi:hypothetical protein